MRAALSKVTPMHSSRSVIGQLWSHAGLPGDALGWLRLTGQDPVLPSSFAVGAAAQSSIAAAGLAAACLLRARGGPAQQVAVDMRHAAQEFRSERLLRVSGAPPPEPWDRIAGLYRTRDGWARLHTNFPHHRDGVLRLLGCAWERQDVARRLAEWDSLALEDAAAEAGLCVAAFRTLAEWDAHPQARAVAALPVVEITRIGDAAPLRLPAGLRPLAGVRVLDLTRVIAGPVCGRTLAAHGAEVLAVTGPHLPSIPALVMDNNRGKRTAQLDLRQETGRDRLAGLLGTADVFVQGYRPGGLAELGFGPESAARASKAGLVYVSLSAYGRTGPWAGRRGFDSLVQTASGLNAAEAEAAGSDQPRVLPAQVLDHASGHLMAFGAMAALHRRMVQGGSWHVQVSLARTARWLRGLGRMPGGLAIPDPGDAPDLTETAPSGFGEMRAVRHSAGLSATPAGYARPSMPLGSDAAAWSNGPAGDDSSAIAPN